jgi:hypothetical protein
MDKSNHIIKYLGFYQFIGGIIGILNTLRFLPNFSQINGGIFLIFLTIFSLFSFSIYCGYSLITKRDINSLNLSIYNQLIQVLGFGILGFAFHFTAGIYAGIKLNLTNDTVLTFMFGHSSAKINLNNYHAFSEIRINFIALLLMNLMFNLKTKLEKNREI